MLAVIFWYALILNKNPYLWMDTKLENIEASIILNYLSIA